MTGLAEGIPVSFHDVKLWAEITTDVRCIAVLKWITCVNLCWHQNRLDSCYAATADAAEIDFELYTSAEQICLEILIWVDAIDQR